MGLSSRSPTSSTGHTDTKPPLGHLQPAFKMPIRLPFSPPKGTTKMSAHLYAEHSRETQRLQAQSKRNSILDARDIVTAFIHDHYEEHMWPNIRVICDLTEAQLREIGRLGRREGLMACCRLIRAPVIHEKVALALWEHLASEQTKDSTSGCSIADQGADQEAWEKHVCACITEKTHPKDGKSPPKDGYSKRITWNRSRSRGPSLLSIAEETEPWKQPPSCVCCPGIPELDCRLPPDIMKEYGTLPGTRDEGTEQDSPKAGRGSVASKSTTSTLGSRSTANSTSPSSSTSTSSAKSIASPSKPRLSLRRSLSFIPALNRLTSYTKAPPSPLPEAEQPSTDICKPSISSVEFSKSGKLALTVGDVDGTIHRVSVTSLPPPYSKAREHGLPYMLFQGLVDKRPAPGSKGRKTI